MTLIEVSQRAYISLFVRSMMLLVFLPNVYQPDIDGILPKGPYPPCLRMADRALSAGYHRYGWYLYLFMLNKLCLSKSPSRMIFPLTGEITCPGPGSRPHRT